MPRPHPGPGPRPHPGPGPRPLRHGGGGGWGYSYDYGGYGYPVPTYDPLAEVRAAYAAWWQAVRAGAPAETVARLKTYFESLLFGGIP